MAKSQAELSPSVHPLRISEGGAWLRGYNIVVGASGGGGVPPQTAGGEEREENVQYLRGTTGGGAARLEIAIGVNP